jgi:protein-disulfide isomerase/uncharacterized membrane protein
VSPNRTGPALLALALAVAGFTVSVILLREHLTVFEGDTAGSLFCGGGGRFDCNVVAAHPSSWMLGLPLAVWGIAFYIAAGVLALLCWRLPDGEAAAAAGVGSVLALAAIMLDLWLGWTMVTKIGAVCMNCVSTYVVNLGLAAAFWRLDRSFTAGHEWGALLSRWRAARPGRWLKIAAVLVGIAGAGGAFFYTGRAVAETMLDSEAEALKLLHQIDTEKPLDVTRFAGLPAEGPATARITIVVASDFQCSFCRALAARLDDVRKQYPNDVRLLFLNAPISSQCNPRVPHDEHHHACWLARAGVCAARQGRFWQYHDLVYRDLPPAHANEAGVRRALGRAGLDAAALDACLASGDADSVVARDVRTWLDLKMESVPSLVINGHLKTGGIYPTTLLSVIRTLLARPA